MCNITGYCKCSVPADCFSNRIASYTPIHAFVAFLFATHNPTGNNLISPQAVKHTIKLP